MLTEDILCWNCAGIAEGSHCRTFFLSVKTEGIVDLTVIITTYNLFSIKQTVESNVELLVNRDIPIVIVDDCSTDGSWEMISKLPSDVNKVRLGTNVGPGVARNIGSLVSRTKYILFLDADDYFSSDFFDILQGVRPDSDVLLTAWAEDKGGYVNQVGPLVADDIYRSLLGNGVLQPIHSVVLNRQYFIQYGMFSSERILCEDFELWLRLFSKRPHVAVIPDICAVYVRHASGRSNHGPLLRRMIASLILREVLSGRTTVRQSITAIRKLLQALLEIFHYRWFSG